MKRDLTDLSHEIECLSDTLGAMGYAVSEGFKTADITGESIARQLFSVSNYLLRIAEDLEEMDRGETEADKPLRMRETVTKVYDLY